MNLISISLIIFVYMVGGIALERVGFESPAFFAGYGSVYTIVMMTWFNKT